MEAFLYPKTQAALKVEKWPRRRRRWLQNACVSERSERDGEKAKERDGDKSKADAYELETNRGI